MRAAQKTLRLPQDPACFAFYAFRSLRQTSRVSSLHHKVRTSGRAPAALTAGDLFRYQSPNVHVRSPPSSSEKRTEVVLTQTDRVIHAHVCQPAGLAQAVHRGRAYAQPGSDFSNGQKGTGGRRSTTPGLRGLYHYCTKRSAIWCNSWRHAAKVIICNPLNFQRSATVGHALRCSAETFEAEGWGFDSLRARQYLPGAVAGGRIRFRIRRRIRLPATEVAAS